MAKDVRKRSSSTIVQERDRQLSAEANDWAREETRAWFEAHRTGFYTASDILASLDERQDAPRAWLRWLSEYPTRYQMVRNALVSLERKGVLEARQEYNALNKPATAYQRASDLDAWTVVVEGGEEQKVTDLLAEWLRENKRDLQGVRAIGIRTRPTEADDTEDTDPLGRKPL